MITIMVAIGAVIVAVIAGCMILAWLTDYESAASTGCLDEGQVW